jgi:uncharacterized membrane protein
VTQLVVLLRFVNLLFGGIYAGFLVAVFVIELTLRGFDGSVYTQMQQVKHLHHNQLAIATLTPTLASALLLVLLLRSLHTTVFVLTLMNLLCMAGALVITLRVNVPINTNQMAWKVGAPPPDWAAIRDRWQLAHTIRTSLAVVGFCCQIPAALMAQAA